MNKNNPWVLLSAIFSSLWFGFWMNNLYAGLFVFGVACFINEII